MEGEKIIALMGSTGAGKSSMIKLITGNQSIAIGHGLTSETQRIESYPFSFMGYNITLVDTPGFDDTYRSDAEILQSIVQWLTTTYKEGTRLSGILYLHRITDVRLQGSALRNLRVFRELCGKDCFKNVAMCPTFWDVAEDHDTVLEERLKELTENEGYWGGMIDMGSKVFREPLTQNEAINMIYQLVTNDTVALQVQKEIVDEQRSASDTSAFATLMSLQLERQRQEHDEMMAEAKRQFEAELQRRQRTLSEDLAGMRKVFEEKLAVVEDANQKLRAEIQAKERRPSSTTIARKPLPQRVQRVTTIATDQKSVPHELVNRRHQRYSSFKQHVSATIQLLESEKWHGRVKCNFLQQKSCYLMVCTNCLRNIGDRDFYKCVSCSVEHDFVLCTQCFKNNAIWCNNSLHKKENMIQGRPHTIGVRCPRLITPPNNSLLLCRKCEQDVGKCYLHCCSCSENFDMCVKCATQGKHCPGYKKSFAGQPPHKLEICARYIEA